MSLGFFYAPPEMFDVGASGSELLPVDPHPNYDDAAVKARVQELYPAFTGSYKIFKNPNDLGALLLSAAKSLRTQMPADTIRSQVHGFLGNWIYSLAPYAHPLFRDVRAKVHKDAWAAMLPLLNSALMLAPTTTVVQTPTMTLSKQAPMNVSFAKRLTGAAITGGGKTITGAPSGSTTIQKSGASQVPQENMINPDLVEPTTKGIEKESLYILGAVALAIVGGIIIFTRK